MAAAVRAVSNRACCCRNNGACGAAAAATLPAPAPPARACGVRRAGVTNVAVAVALRHIALCVCLLGEHQE